MRAWTLLLAAAAGLAAAAPAAGQTRQVATTLPPARIAIDAHVREASQRFGMPAQWIYAVIRAESAGRVRAVSRAGAMGLMQLMPGTWARQRARHGLGVDPFDPRDNILAGTSYLREMYDRYGVPGFLAAYNAGPGRYEDWRAGRRSLPPETRQYVARLAPQLQAGRAFIASDAHLAEPPDPSESLPSGPAATRQLIEVGDGSANPFARAAQPAHDLFAAVSTAIDR